MASKSKYAPQTEHTSSSSSTVGPLDTLSDDSSNPGNPYLTQPVLYISDLDARITDKELASSVFSACLPVRLHIDRDDEATRVCGKAEFQSLNNAEKAYATIQSLRLSINQEPSKEPEAKAQPRLIKQLPPATEDSDVYDLFRPFGPLFSATRILTNPTGAHTGFRGMALVTYYNEDDAIRAQTEMHCIEVEGRTISVTVDTVSRKPSGTASFSPSAPPFVPGASLSHPSSTSTSMNAAAPAFHPPAQSSSALYGPGSQHNFPAQAPTYVDPCNLFCKNLEANVDSNDLYHMFREFGHIVSARVMRDQAGMSREFGFVSFKTPAQASKALSMMNGKQHGSKQLVVRLHEPKNVRQEKLSYKFGTNFVPPSPDQEGTGSGGPSSDVNDSPSADVDSMRTSRRMSNSYFRAAASGANGQVDVDQLESMNATLRGDILRGGFSRKVKELPDIPSNQVDALVEELTKLQLPDAVTALNDNKALAQHVNDIRAKGELPTGLLESAPIGDSTSISILSESGASEREKFVSGIKEILPQETQTEELADLLIGLPKKERAKALFSQEYLRLKVEEAKAILDLDDEEGEEAKATRTNGKTSYTLVELARLPAVEIIRLANDPLQTSGSPLGKADPTVVRETDAFIDGLQDMPSHDQKQKLGDQLFKKIRSFNNGVKGVPKITITLLDTEDLRSLAHLMNSYPHCLREKVNVLANSGSK